MPEGAALPFAGLVPSCCIRKSEMMHVLGFSVALSSSPELWLVSQFKLCISKLFSPLGLIQRRKEA